MKPLKWVPLTMLAGGILGGVVMFQVLTESAEGPDWEALKRSIRERFPSVKQVSVSEAETWLSSTNRPEVLLLDSRSREEFEVSHLRGARWIEPDADMPAWVWDQPRERRILVYCSVGYRSSALSERLAAEGFTNVFNLEGSNFEWANSSRPVYKGTHRVEAVHPYDRRWGRYLDESLRPNRAAGVP